MSLIRNTGVCAALISSVAFGDIHQGFDDEGNPCKIEILRSEASIDEVSVSGAYYPLPRFTAITLGKANFSSWRTEYFNRYGDGYSSFYEEKKGKFDVTTKKKILLRVSEDAISVRASVTYGATFPLIYGTELECYYPDQNNGLDLMDDIT